jgi:hypothetical protein
MVAACDRVFLGNYLNSRFLHFTIAGICRRDTRTWRRLCVISNALFGRSGTVRLLLNVDIQICSLANLSQSVGLRFSDSLPL